MSDPCYDLESGAMVAWKDGLTYRGVSYCGIPCNQIWTDFLLWERILNLHPEVERIVEIGTLLGGFSLYLAHQAEQRGIRFETRDVRPRPETKHPIDHVRGDVFQPLATAALRRLLSDAPTVLFCDGGDKPLEAATFGPALLPGSLLIAHDYGTEFFDADIPPGFEPAHTDLTAEHRSMSCVLTKT